MIVSVPCPDGHDFDLTISDEAARHLVGDVRGVVCSTCSKRLIVQSSAVAAGSVVAEDVEEDTESTTGGESTHPPAPSW
jgi:CRISPR/Cas system CSM-associated protein Csm4 (group 5 of RAMP superfamily)